MPRRVTRARTTAGDRSHLVTIHAPAGTIAEDAADVEADVPVAIEAWPVSSQPQEATGLGGVQSATYYTVTMGYRTDVRPSYVLLEQCCTQRRLQIVAPPVPTDRRDALGMTCVASA